VLGNVYIILQQIYSENSVPNYHQNRKSLIEDNKKNSLVFFSAHTVM